MFNTLGKVVLFLCLFPFATGCAEQGSLSIDKTDNQTERKEVGDTSGTVKDVSQERTNENTGWHFFRGNANSTGVATSSLPDELVELWKHEIKGGAFESTPIVVGGDNKRIYIGDADGKFFAFDLESGNVDWTVETEFGFATAAAWNSGKLYVGDIDGKFYCFNEAGDQIWDYQAGGSIDSSANFFDNLVLFGSRDANLYALNCQTGKEVWKLETADEVRCGITVIDGHAFVAGCDGSLHAIDIAKGKEAGSVAIESPTGVTPAAKGSFAYAGTEQAGFFAVNWRESKLVWSFNDDGSGISTRSSPALTDKHVVFGSSHRTVYSLDPKTGKKNWTTELKSGIESSPVIVGKYVFIGSTDGRLNKLDLNSGKIVWNKQLNGGLVGSPAVAFGRLVIATDRGVVYCLGK